MRRAFLVLSAMVLCSPRVAAWNEDPRCPGYRSSRALLEGDDPDIVDIDYDYESDLVTPHEHDFESAVAITSNSLRGSASNVHRELSQDFDFQLKMHWEEGFCWQEEWDERKWCMSCAGDVCNLNDLLLIQKCDGKEKIQRFMYEPVSGTGGGKIMPLTRPDLCWERVPSVNEDERTEYKLRDCEISNKSTQIVVGFDPSKPFELKTYGRTTSCFTQDHHPKPDEVVRAGSCRLARIDHTSEWVVYDRSPDPNVPVTARPGPTSSCPPIDLKLESSEVIKDGETFRNSDVSLEQERNGNLLVRKGDNIIWESGVNKSNGDYFTVLQGDGNMITYEGKTSDRGDSVWKSRSAGPGGNKFFLALDCGGDTISIYQGTAKDPGKTIWTSERMGPPPPPTPSPPSAPTPPEPTPPEPTGSCQPGGLNFASKQVIREGQSLQNKDLNVYFEQEKNGNLLVRRGENLLWQSGVFRSNGEYFTILQGDGHLITYKGTPSKRGDSVWKSHTPGDKMSYFLGIDCGRDSVSIYQGTLSSPGNRIWTSDTFGRTPPLVASPSPPATNPSGKVLRVPFDASVLDYSDFIQKTSKNRGSCGVGPVDATSVDDATCNARGSKCTVAWTEKGEALMYEIEVGSKQEVDITIRLSSEREGKRLYLAVDGKRKYLEAPGKGWDDFDDYTWKNVSLDSGRHTLEIHFENGQVNLCSVSVQRA